MADDETLQRVRREALDSLFRIPGVRAVALGHKYIGGTNTNELSIIVKVDRKRPASEVPSAELIPPEIQGIKTDVRLWRDRIPLSALIEDTSKERPLVGGSSIIVEYETPDPANAAIKQYVSTATLGFIAQTDGSISGIPAGGIVGVTNQHVIADDKGNTVKGHEVGQPTTDECSSCSFCCNDIIGKVLYAVNIGTAADHNRVDAALVALTKGLDYYADIKGIGPAGANLFVKGSRPLTTADVGKTVSKYGKTTGFTQGTIDIVSQAVKLGSGPAYADGQIDITPAAGTKVWDCCVCKHGKPGCGGGDLENFVSFGCAGDSGSAIVDDQQNIVGLLSWVSCGDGTGIAIGIDDVMTTLGVKVVTATAIKQKLTVPGVVGVNMVAGEVPQTIAAFRISSALQESFQRAREELVATPIGQDVAATVREHHVEVLELINTNRRVATVWHRNGGAELIEGVLRMVQFRDRPLPSEIRGRPLADCLQRLQRAFERYGSPALGAAANAWYPMVAGLAGCTFPQLLETLQTGSAV
jgi:hypothetical protein